jgi:hypothetical protein
VISDGDADIPQPSSGPSNARASDRGRDGALELLATAAGDGRLTLEEYSTRADTALRARMLSELSDLTNDLSRTSDAPADGPGQLTAILGNESRKGRWRVPPHVAARSVLGDCHLELQDAVLTSHVTTIEARATLGAITIFVPDGIEVRLSGTAILGAKSSTVRAASVPGAPVIDVRARAVLGNVTVRSAKLRDRMRDPRPSPPARLDPG